jgi:DNA-nicking Smr family endonuclease
MEEETITVPIDGVLDLHTFRPSEVGDLVPAYLSACHEAGILEVRIVHGKGTGSLRRSVHAVLSRLDMVASYSSAGDERGGWGATIVMLKRGKDGISSPPRK